MSTDILVIVEQSEGCLADTTFELLGAARLLASGNGGRVIAALPGENVAPLASALGAADTVCLLDDPRLALYTPEAYTVALEALVRSRPPALILIGATSVGLDTASVLSARLGLPLVCPCRNIRFDNTTLVATAQICGGKILCDVEIGQTGGIVAILPGMFPAERGRSDRQPVVEKFLPEAWPPTLRTTALGLRKPDGEDIDISRIPVLVSVGRGLQSRDNLPLVEELARVLGGAVSASRPVVDQGWLPMTRQVGRSGITVKSKAYLALGISGAPEHLEGMRNAELIVAVNTDPHAPIFGVAHVGAVADLLDVVPALTENLQHVRQS